ncbi:MAG: ABC transporter ATP-binding protein, partial [bacterium]|nr:ABC transporter ATP-binding protein [bacterium]
MIEIKNLSFKYGRKSVIKNIDADIRKGDFILLAGNNGAGKSTLLKCLAGVLSPHSGGIKLKDSLTKKEMGFISQELSFYENFSLANAVHFHNDVYGGGDSFDNSLAKELGLKMDSRVKNLSVGERTLFLFSLVLMQKPKCLLLDEIIHAIDPYLRELFLEKLLEMIDVHGTTVIAVNHTFAEIERIPDRVMIMEDGKITLNEETETLRTKVKKIELGPGQTGDDIPGDLPLVFKKESQYLKEYFVYPFEESMRDSGRFDFRDMELSEIMKSFIGGYY